MFFSVIVTIYNGEAFLAPCLDSILRNPAGNYELIIVNDGSTDRTDEICEDYARHYPRVKCVHTENRGIGNARQAGLEAAMGEYILFVDGDDAWGESFLLDEMEERIKSVPADLYVFGYVLRRLRLEDFRDQAVKVEAATFDDWRENQGRFLTYFPEGIMFLCWNKVFKRNLIVENHIVSVQQHMEDFRFVLEYLKAAKAVVFLDEEPYIHIKRNDQDLSSSAYQGMLEGYNLCHRLFLSLFDKEHAAAIHRVMAPAYMGTINRHLGFIDRHEKETTAKRVLSEIPQNELAQEALRLYHPESFSEKVTVYLMRKGCFRVLRQYRNLVGALKRMVH